MPETPTPSPRCCQNCDAPLYGDHCFACGQPRRGLVRNLGSFLDDLFDVLLNLDGRIVRTLPPLMLKPGYLTTEYLAGHRVRYVSPVRLFMVLCLAVFLAAQWLTPSITASTKGGDLQIGFGVQGDFSQSDTPAEVEAERQRLLKALEAAQVSMPAPALREILDEGRKEIDEAAKKRLDQLSGTAEVAEEVLDFNGEPWDAKTNPLRVPFAPAFVDDWVNAQVAHVPDNLKRIQDDPDLLRNAIYSALPTAMFVLVPLFAVVLKLLYVYQRRLYMEHLIVALHGHAFLCIGALVQMMLFAIDDAQPWFSLWPLEAALWVWMPLYLWKSLRRIYGQGRVLTTINFMVLGVVELFLLSITTALAGLAALVWL